MPKRCTINEIYDIAAAFITDRNTTVQATCTDRDTIFTFTKRGLAEHPYTLVISAEHGAPSPIPNTPYTNKKCGNVYLHRGTGVTGTTHIRTVVSAQTKFNVGRFFDKNQRSIVQIGTAMLSPKFFELVEMAEKRVMKRIETKNNTTQMFNLLYRIQNENQK